MSLQKKKAEIVEKINALQEMNSVARMKAAPALVPLVIELMFEVIDRLEPPEGEQP